VVIWETASNMGVLVEVIKDLDVPLQQVLIEGSIVEVNADKASEIGIDYNVSRTGDPALSADMSQPVQNLASPAGFTFGTVKSGLNINATISLLEDHKQAKTISRPKIATQNGVPAIIETVETVVYLSRSETRNPGSDLVTVTTTAISLPLPIKLSVIPRIAEDGRITTILDVSITSVSGPAVSLPGGGSSQPPTTTQAAKTILTVRNGETIVIGGLVRDIMQEEHKRVPLLGSLPIFGGLFRNTYKDNRKVELIIFITPTLIEP
jgi:type II secretory pathway component GspD/PulD (secretin)